MRSNKMNTEEISVVSGIEGLSLWLWFSERLTNLALLDRFMNY